MVLLSPAKAFLGNYIGTAESCDGALSSRGLKTLLKCRDAHLQKTMQANVHSNSILASMLSLVVGTVAVLPATAAFLSRKHVPLPVTLLLAHIAASGFAVAIAASDLFASRSTFLLGKQPSGRIAWWAWPLFWPYHLSLQTKLWIQRQTSKEPVWNQIGDEGW